MRLGDEILGKNPDSWWKFLGGVVAIPVLYIVISTLFGMLLNFGTAQGWWTIDLAAALDDSVLGGSAPDLFALFMGVGIAHLAIAPYIRLAYGRDYVSVINPLEVHWRAQCLYGAAYIGVVLLVSEIIGIIAFRGEYAIDYVWNIKTWFLWIFPMSLAVLLQTSAEELFVRGFLQQYLARLINIKWIYIVVPCLVWTLAHLGNFESSWLRLSALFSIFVFGLALGDWADISGSLWGPIAAHFINNLFLTVVYGNSIEPSVMQIFRADVSAMSDQEMAIYTLFTSLLMGLVYLPVRKRLIARRQAIA